MNELHQQLKKYEESLNYYSNYGDNLYSEIIKSAQISYEAGEIDIYRFIQSMETAINIKMEYLENLYQSNLIALEINYLTL